MFSYLQALQLHCVIFFHIIELFLKVTPLNAKILHNSGRVPAPEHAVCVHSNLYITFRVNWASVSTYMFSCRLILVPAFKVYMQGVFWGRLDFSTWFVCFFFCVCISCVPLYSTNYAFPCVCVPAVSFLCMSAFFRSLHTSNKFWTAYTLLYLSVCVSLNIRAGEYTSVFVKVFL